TLHDCEIKPPDQKPSDGPERFCDLFVRRRDTHTIDEADDTACYQAEHHHDEVIQDECRETLPEAGVSVCDSDRCRNGGNSDVGDRKLRAALHAEPRVIVVLLTTFWTIHDLPSWSPLSARHRLCCWHPIRKHEIYLEMILWRPPFPTGLEAHNAK